MVYQARDTMPARHPATVNFVRQVNMTYKRVEHAPMEQEPTACLGRPDEERPGGGAPTAPCSQTARPEPLDDTTRALFVNFTDALAAVTAMADRSVKYGDLTVQLRTDPGPSSTQTTSSPSRPVAPPRTTFLDNSLLPNHLIP